MTSQGVVQELINELIIIRILRMSFLPGGFWVSVAASDSGSSSLLRVEVAGLLVLLM
jgi:hypothetical protein